MFQLKYLAPLAAIVCAFSSCSDSSDSLTEKTISIQTKMNGIYDSITDKASADKAIPELKKCTEEMSAVLKSVKDLDPATAAKAPDEATAKKLQEISAKTAANMIRLQGLGLITPEFIQAITPTM